MRHKDIVKSFLDAKAIDLAAVGAVFGQLAPGAALEDEPGDFVCGVGFRFFHCFQPQSGIVVPSGETQEG